MRHEWCLDWWNKKLICFSYVLYDARYRLFQSHIFWETIPEFFLHY